MSMQYIRDHYRVPAKRGGRILYSGDTLKQWLYGFMYSPAKGTIVGSKGNYLRVRFDDLNMIQTLHPTWKVKYVKI